MERFLAVLNSGDIQGLLDVLAPDVVLVADGGGRVAAARQPIEGADRVVEFLSRFARIASRADGRIVWLNGAPAVRIDLDGELDTAVSLVIEGRADLPHLRGPQPGQAGPTSGKSCGSAELTESAPQPRGPQAQSAPSRRRSSPPSSSNFCSGSAWSASCLA